MEKLFVVLEPTANDVSAHVHLFVGAYRDAVEAVQVVLEGQRPRVIKRVDIQELGAYDTMECV